MEAQRGFLLRVLEALEQAGLRYAITGSWASTTYGLPRTTHDLDVVVALTAESAGRLAEAFAPPIYADAVWMAEAAAEGTGFNIIDPASGLKVDFWPLRDEAYARQQFERRRQQTLFGRSVWMLAPEDVILSKLLWYRQSESDIQLRDSAGIGKMQKDALDQGYMRHWSVQLGVSDLLSRIMAD